MDARLEAATLPRSRVQQQTVNPKNDAQIRSAAPLSSISRLRCFLVPDGDVAIPRIDGIDYIVDAEDDFDVFIAPSVQAGTFADFIACCGNPAAPMIAFADRPHPRADVLVKERNSSSFAAAISSLQPLLKKTAALPRLPRGPDRNGLLALALMYTRNCSLDARWQPNRPDLVEYPLLCGVDNPRRVLEDMADADLVRRRFYQRVHQCSQCASSRLHARECCTSCHSSQLVESPLVHHYSCAFQGPQSLFDTADGYVCPKCRKQLRHYGVDYDKPGSVISCADCGATQSEPEVGFTCLDCDSYTSGDHAAHRDWYHYDLLPDGVAALRSGELPHESALDPHVRSHSLRNFRFAVARLLAVAQRHDRPLTLCRIHLNNDALVAQEGRRGFLEISRFVRDLIAENLRESDLLSSLPDGSVLCCLPETEQNVAEAACVQLRRIIGRSIRVQVDSGAQVIGRDDVAAYLQELGHVG